MSFQHLPIPPVDDSQSARTDALLLLGDSTVEIVCELCGQWFCIHKHGLQGSEPVDNCRHILMFVTRIPTGELIHVVNKSRGDFEVINISTAPTTTTARDGYTQWGPVGRKPGPARPRKRAQLLVEGFELQLPLYGTTTPEA